MNSDIQDAKPLDIYVDESGKLWRVMGICGEPSVIMQEIESPYPDNPVRMSGGIGGLMWKNFKRIWKNENKI